MNGYDFSRRIRVALLAAREIAVTSRHDYVEPGHLLLALLREGDNVATAVLASLGVDFTTLAKSVVGRMKPGRATATVDDALAYTSRAKKTLELAMSEARELSHDQVGTGHLLLGLIREEKGTAAVALSDLGLSINAVRAGVVRHVTSGVAED